MTRKIPIEGGNATPVGVFGTVTADTGLVQPLTDTQLRASAVPVSASALPLPSGAATSANQTTANTSLSSIDTGIGGASAAAAGDTGASTTNGFLRWLRDWFVNRTGQKASSASMSVVNASDDPIVAATGAKADSAASDSTSAWSVVALLKGLYALLSGQIMVRGQAAVGAAPSNYPIAVSCQNPSGNKQHIQGDATGRLYAIPPEEVSTSGTAVLTQLNDTWPAAGVGYAIPKWARTASVVLSGTFSLTGTFQFSFDNAATWVSSPMGVNPVNGSSTTNASTAGQVVLMTIPPGATHVQIKCTAYTSGQASVLLTLSATQITTYISTIAAPGANRIGQTAAPGIWYDDTSTALTANSTFTSTSRDVTGAASGSPFFSASVYPKEYRVLAEQDVAFTLYLEVSRDNSTFRRIKQVAAAQNVTSGLYIAELRESPAWRYYRYVIANSGTNAAHTTGGSILMAN